MNYTGNNYGMDNCVCDTVMRIIEAQNKVAQKSHCESSCEQSIKDLLSPTRHPKSNHTTIPFILYNKGNLKPFIANGVFKSPIKDYPHEKYYNCIETPIFKAKKFVRGSNCCVILELLRPVNANGIPIADRGEKLCDFFSNQTPCKTIHFRKTGICITVDLNCFCGITCLDPITPLPVYEPPTCKPSLGH